MKKTKEVDLTDDELAAFLKMMSDHEVQVKKEWEDMKPKPLTKEQIYEKYLNGGHKSKSGVNELLFISPDLIAKKSSLPSRDSLNKKVDYILSKTYKGEGDAKKRGFKKKVDWGMHQYFGYHRTTCGQKSDCQDWYIPTKNGVWTNSLAGYYTKYYRQFIPQAEVDKIEAIYKELKEME